MLEDQQLRPAVQRVNRRSRPHDLIHTGRFEIRVTQGSANEQPARRQRAEQLVKIKGDVSQTVSIIKQLRQVAVAGPAFDVAVHVVQERIESATGDDDLYALVENPGVDGVVAAEGVPDGAEIPLFDKGQRLQ